VVAQDLLNSSDLSTLKVDSLSDADIAKIKTQLQANNSTVKQMESVALSKGMSLSRFAKLKVRLDADATSTVSNKGTDSSSEESTRSQEKIINNKIKDISLVFWLRAFDNPTLNFQPNLKLATPMNYILGPGDELQVSLNGVQEYIC
jgi:hypothetical protein